ncbi:MAG: hypothetical protein J5980_10985, partial [Muribaculaceae bacterium]|nr:hypothetical protein [Muribaculaceae bacterium]
LHHLPEPFGVALRAPVRSQALRGCSSYAAEIIQIHSSPAGFHPRQDLTFLFGWCTMCHTIAVGARPG